MAVFLWLCKYRFSTALTLLVLAVYANGRLGPSLRRQPLAGGQRSAATTVGGPPAARAASPTYPLPPSTPSSRLRLCAILSPDFSRPTKRFKCADICISIYIDICIYIYIYVYSLTHVPAAAVDAQFAFAVVRDPLSRFGLHKIFVYVQAVVHEPTVLSFPPPTCIVHLGAILLHVYWTI